MDKFIKDFIKFFARNFKSIRSLFTALFFGVQLFFLCGVIFAETTLAEAILTTVFISTLIFVIYKMVDPFKHMRQRPFDFEGQLTDTAGLYVLAVLFAVFAELTSIIIFAFFIFSADVS